MWVDRTDTRSAATIFRDFILKRSAEIFAVSLIFPPAIVGVVNYVHPVNFYNNAVLMVAGYQAIITAYLSLKIYSVGMRDSFLPSLSFYLDDVSETDVPWDDHICVRCEYKITNHSFGRAKIRNVEVLKHNILAERTPPVDKDVSVGFPNIDEWPVTLDKGEETKITIQINGLGYFEDISIGVDEMNLGRMEYDLILSDISNYLLMLKKD